MLLYILLCVTAKCNLHVTLNVTAHCCTKCPRRRCNLTYWFLLIYFIFIIMPTF